MQKMLKQSEIQTREQTSASEVNPYIYIDIDIDIDIQIQIQIYIDIGYTC